MSLSRALLVSQFAMSLLMLLAAGLFVRTLSNLQSIQLGFNRENVLLFDVNARQAGHREPEISAFYADLRRRLRSDSGRAQRHALPFLSHPRRPAIVDQCFRHAGHRHPHSEHRTQVLHHHADSDPARPGDRRTRSAGLAAGGRGERAVRQKLVGQGEPAGAAHQPGRIQRRPARTGNRRRVRQRPLRRSEAGYTAGRVHSI